MIRLPVAARRRSRPRSVRNGCESAASSRRRRRRWPGSPVALSPSSIQPPRSCTSHVAQKRPGETSVGLSLSICLFLSLSFSRSGTPPRSRWLDGSTSSERPGSTGTASLDVPPPMGHLRGLRYLLVPRCTSVPPSPPLPVLGVLVAGLSKQTWRARARAVRVRGSSLGPRKRARCVHRARPSNFFPPLSSPRFFLLPPPSGVHHDRRRLILNSAGFSILREELFPTSLVR